MVRRIFGRVRGHGVDGMAGATANLGISGFVFTGSFDWLCNWANGLLSLGDGDYGKPTSLPWGMSFPNGVVPTTEHVHPTPLYELIVWCAIGWLLWRLGASALKRNLRPMGEIFCYYLILTGIARFLVEIIRINPPWIWGLSNAQVASVVSVMGGLVLLVVRKRDGVVET